MLRYSERIAIKDAEIRKKLKGSQLSASILPAVKLKEPWLLPLISYIVSRGPEEMPLAWRKLLKDLSCGTPVSGLFHIKDDHTIAFLKTVSEKNALDINDLRGLSTAAPVFYQVYREGVDGEASSALRSVMAHLITKLEYIRRIEPHTRENEAKIAVTSEDGLPCLPVRFKRGYFVMDKGVQKVCSKKAPKHKSLTPGIFTINCPHSE